MAITTLDGYIAAAKQRKQWSKTATRPTIATGWFSLFDVAGNPGAGTLNAGNTASGIVPVDGDNGYPTMSAFGGGATGYLSLVQFFNSVACRMAVFDRLFVAGAYAFNANTALASQPDYSGRLVGGDWNDCELWVEEVTAATGSLAVNISYTNQSGAAKTTGAVGIGGAPTLGRCWQLPLATGDTGVQAITNVTGTVATAGTFNVMVLRRLWQTGGIRQPNAGDVHDFLKTGLPQVFETTALYVLVSADSTNSGLPDLMLEIASG